MWLSKFFKKKQKPINPEDYDWNYTWVPGGMVRSNIFREQMKTFYSLHEDFQKAVNEGNPIAAKVWETMIECGDNPELLRGCITGLASNLIDIYKKAK